jgi:hypothetical protein
VKGKQRLAYEENLDVCFIVRMPRELRDHLREHAEWMARRDKVPKVSLAAASRNLLRRGIMTTPGGKEKRRQERERQKRAAAKASPQLKFRGWDD